MSHFFSAMDLSLAQTHSGGDSLSGKIVFYMLSSPYFLVELFENVICPYVSPELV